MTSGDGAGLVGVGLLVLVIAGAFEYVSRRRVRVGDLSREQDRRRAVVFATVGVVLVTVGLWLIVR